MKTDLFKKMYKIFKKHTGVRRQTDLFLYFARMEWADPLSPNIYKYISGRRRLNEETIKHIRSNNDWTSSKSPFAEAVKADNYDLFDDLEKLHKEYLPDVNIPASCNDILGNLIQLCLCEDYQRHTPSIVEPRFNCKGSFVTKSTIKNLIKRDKLLEDIRTNLEEHGKVILSGGAGMGKTSLLKYFYYENQCKIFTDFCHIEYIHSLDDSIENIEFVKERQAKDQRKWELLSLKKPDSLLFIDSMNCPAEEMEKALKKLSGLKLKVIIATRNSAFPDIFPVIRVPAMDDRQLSEIYRKDIPNAGESSSVLKKLFELLDRNPMAVALAARLASENAYSFETLFAILKNAEFDTLKGSREFHYQGSEHNYLGHIRLIYKEYCKTLPKEERTMLAALSCFGNALVPRRLFTQWIDNVDKKWLQSMINIGVLSDSTPNVLQMQRLTADAIFLVERPHYKSYKKLISKLHEDIKESRHSLSLVDIHDAVREIIVRLSKTVKTYNNANQQSFSKEQESWWEFVLDGIIYLLDSGKTGYVEYLLENIYTIRRKTTQEGSAVWEREVVRSHPYYIFKEVLDIYNKWINDCGLDDVIFNIERLQKYASQNAHDTLKVVYEWVPALSWFLTILADFVYHITLHSMMHLTLFETGNVVHARVQFSQDSLQVLVEFILRSSSLSRDERVYYLSVCDFLYMDTYTPEYLFSAVARICEKYTACTYENVRIKYICTSIIFLAACVVFSKGNPGIIVCIQHMKEFLDSKISMASSLSQMISRFCISAYYYYAATQNEETAISVKEQVIECCDKTPGLLKAKKDSILKIFDKFNPTNSA